MEQNRVQRETLRLVENVGSCSKLIIPEEVQKKIREWCYISNDTEWSGTLFYKPTGSFEEKNLVITVVDFLVSDIGSGAYTEYDVKPEVISYMVENDLLDCKMGLIHSHNKMAAFFSGTDISTLGEEGKDAAHFVSLIVNNEGKYVARITRKIVEKRSGTKKVSYPTFDEQTVTLEESSFEDEENTYLEFMNLQIEIEENTELRTAVAQRYKEILANKKPAYNSYGGGAYGGFHQGNNGYAGRNWGEDDEDDYSPSLFPALPIPKEKEEEEEKEKTEISSLLAEALSEVDEDLSLFHLSKDKLDEYLGQLLFGCITFSAEGYRKQNKEKWVSESMEKVLDKRFGGDLKAYESYMNGVTEVICRNVDDPILKGQLSRNTATSYNNIESDMCTICARDILIELDKLTKGKPHKYIDVIVTCLLDFVYG